MKEEIAAIQNHKGKLDSSKGGSWKFGCAELLEMFAGVGEGAVTVVGRVERMNARQRLGQRQCSAALGWDARLPNTITNFPAFTPMRKRQRTGALHDAKRGP
jgi:hypothetical protein